METKTKRMVLISKFDENSLELVDMRFLPPKILVPNDIKDYKFLSRGIEEVDIKNNKVRFITPSMVALQINIANEALIEIKALNSKIQNLHSKQKLDDGSINNLLIEHTLEVYNFIEHAQKAIIFSFTALETFINLSIPNDFIWSKTTPRKTEVYNKEQIERYISWKEKINLIVTDIYQVPQIKQMSFWSDLIELLDIRNRLIHIKSSDDTEVLTDLLNKNIFKICFSSQEYINYISENMVENDNLKAIDIEKFPIISSKNRIALIQENVDKLSPVYIPEEYKNSYL
ncbi:hypothetical protein ACFPZK_05065 [Psychrobacter urativorans]|uniref:hypothetical protein n=1 Tax=Psychrobacter urativorans TaxID=45610 RepID=UPI0019194AD8|nr:hypothetical protein [Psychrobacter urativorans]